MGRGDSGFHIIWGGEIQDFTHGREVQDFTYCGEGDSEFHRWGVQDFTDGRGVQDFTYSREGDSGFHRWWGGGFRISQMVGG